MLNKAVKNIYVSTGLLGKQKVIVSGSRGYIGKRLMTELLEVQSGNLGIVPVGGNEIFVHLAASVSEDSLSAFLDNLALDYTVINYCQKHKLKLVYASGNNVYPFKENCDEDTPYQSNDYYSLSKITGEKLLFLQEKKLDFVIFRIGDVYGFNQKHGNFFKALQSSILGNNPFHLFGEGGKKRSYIYIEELIEVFKYFIDNPQFIKNDVYNVCFDEANRVNEIIEKLSELTGLDIQKSDYVGNIDVRTMSNQKLKAVGYNFLFNMHSGLEDYVRKIRN